jgi:hypothetical protein
LASPSSSHSVSQKASISARSAGSASAAFMRQQPALDVEQKTVPLAGKAAQPAARRQNAMAGNDHRKGIGSRRPGQPPAARCAVPGDLAVAARLVRRDGRDLLPDTALKRCAGWAQGQDRKRTRRPPGRRELARRSAASALLRRDFGRRRQEGDALDFLLVAAHAEAEAGIARSPPGRPVRRIDPGVHHRRPAASSGGLAEQRLLQVILHRLVAEPDLQQRLVEILAGDVLAFHLPVDGQSCARSPAASR